MNLLSPFGKIYGRVMDVRNALYDRGTFKSYPLGRRTISVGNLTTGGTGKTPLVAYIAKTLLESGEKPCILTRGYGRKDAKRRVLVSDGKKVLVDAEIGGDEPVELARKLNGEVVIVADPDRVAAAKWALSEFDISSFILDDGFQHRRAQRDLDIVCIDATNPFGNGRILPAGSLRESLTGLRRADAIVLTRSDQAGNLDEIEENIRKRNRTVPMFKARTTLLGFAELNEFQADMRSVQSLNKPFFAFTGIGRPEQFFASIKKNGISLSGDRSFADHHRFTQADVAALEDEAKLHRVEALITTAKDAVKLDQLKFELPCYVAVTETVIDDVEAFRGFIVS